MKPDELKAWRTRLNLTQEALAAALGIPKRTVEEWEASRGKGNPPAYLELALCELERRLKRKRKG